MKKTQDLMKRKVFTISPDATMLDAYRMMKSRDIRHLPVISNAGELVGILSDRDIQRAMICHKISDFQQEVHLSNEIMVSDFMNWPVYTTSEHSSVVHATKVMLEQKVSALVVQNEAGNVTGILTTSDLLKYLTQNLDDSNELRIKPLSVFLY